MKLFYCPECRQLVDIMSPKHGVHKCYCGKHFGKYLDDRITAVFTKGAIIVGIDNNTWLPAVQRYKQHEPNGEQPYPVRIDFFFTGWIPTIPGEVIWVDTEQEVHDFPMNYEAGNEYSTMPNSEPKKLYTGPPKICNQQVCYCDNNGVCLKQ